MCGIGVFVKTVQIAFIIIQKSSSVEVFTDIELPRSAFWSGANTLTEEGVINP